MNKKEVLEIQKQLKKDNCHVNRICGCYVDGHKEKIATMKEAFLSLPEEEMFKYSDILKKTITKKILPLHKQKKNTCIKKQSITI